MLTKPAKGTALRAKRRRKRAGKTAERQIMNLARARDGGCRYPGCLTRLQGVAVHVAHQHHRGAGGNPSGSRTTLPTLVSLCAVHHKQYDDKVFTITTSAHGFDGPARFTRRWTPGFGGGVVGTTEPRGVTVTDRNNA